MDVAGGRNATRREKRAAAKKKQRAEEAQTRALEAALVDASKAPESVDEFERLLLASPNSSMLWIQLMAFHLSQTQIAEAREVAEKALKTISFKEETDKLNVWVAYLNLENMHGTQGSLNKVFKRAVKYNDAFTIHEKLLEVYEASSKWEEADALWDITVRQFGKAYSRAWTGFFMFKLRHASADEARSVLQRAMQSVPKTKHTNLVTKCATLEFKFGSPERGRTLLEDVLASKPKRLDVWNVYVDMETKHGSKKRIRKIFDRMILLPLPLAKMRKVFARYLAFEAEHGDERKQAGVREKAQAFVEAWKAKHDEE